MTLTELKAERKRLLANKDKRGRIKRKAMIRACDAWIKKRRKK
jgi:hypothetical protein